MKVGQMVNLYNPEDGSRVDAVVVQITGSGKSSAKKLNLRVRDGEQVHEYADVPHHRDVENGGMFWMVKGYERAPKEWDKKPAKKEAKK